MSDKQPNSVKRWAVAAAKLLIVVVVVWFIRQTIVDGWRQLGQRSWDFNFGWLTASGVFYLLGMLFCGIFWHRTLRTLGQPVGLWQTLRAYYIGQLGKYVPGKALVVILRTGLVQGRGVDTSLAAASVFFETLTMMASGAMIGATIVLIWFRQHTSLFWVALAIVVTAGIPVFPPVFRRLARLVGVGKSDPSIIDKLAALGYGTMLQGWALTGIAWIFLGLSYGAMLCGLGVADGLSFGQMHLNTAAVTLATVAGFVSFMPGGAVVREAVLTELMAPHLGDAVALVGAILLRLIWLAAELIISGILYCAKGLGVRD